MVRGIEQIFRAIIGLTVGLTGMFLMIKAWAESPPATPGEAAIRWAIIGGCAILGMRIAWMGDTAEKELAELSPGLRKDIEQLDRENRADSAVWVLIVVFALIGGLILALSGDLPMANPGRRW